MATTELLVTTFNSLGIPVAGAKVLDCCAGEAQLAFELAPHFGSVTSNDLDPKSRSQTHYDVRRPDFWASARGVHDYVITKPPSNLVETILHQALEQCSLVAMLVSNEKLSQMSNILAHKPITLSVSLGTSNTWLVWAPSLTYRNIFIEFSDNDISLRGRLPQDDYLHHIKDRIAFSLSRSLPSQHHQSSMPAAAAAAAGGTFVPGAHAFYGQPQFQSSPYHFGYAPEHGGAAMSVDQYQLYGGMSGEQRSGSGANPATVNSGSKRGSGANSASNSNTSVSTNETASTATGVKFENGQQGGNGNGSAFEFSSALGPMGSSIGSGYAGRHPSAAAYAQPMIPYYARASGQPPSPTQAWHFQQAPWAAPPSFSAAQLASSLGGASPTATGAVPGGYPGAPQFNPAAILMDMDKFTQQQQQQLQAGFPGLHGGTGIGGAAAMAHAGSRSLTDSTTTSAGSSPSGPGIGYGSVGLHKPTAFKAGPNVPSSTSPSSSPSPGASEDQLMLSQAEMLYLKGVHAAKQGKALEVAIDKYRTMYSKKDVITKVCKMKYRSAQRKLRIAKHIQRFPEISTMTQRQAERYISEKLRKSRGLPEGRHSGEEEE